MKTAIVTGASSGIGKSISTQFSQNGWNVVLIARNQERLEKLKSELPNSNFIVCDLADKDSLLSMRAEIEKLSVNALINNAGIYRPHAIDEVSDEPW